jgi:two-component system phosphate regulon sensor histidine kinase PhoR
VLDIGLQKPKNKHKQGDAMKKAIFRRFIMILSLALVLSGSIFSAVISNIILDLTEKDMLSLVKAADSGLDYEGNLKDQIDKLEDMEGNRATRFTVIDRNGNVIADSDVEDSSTMENHRNREEVKEALRNGIGFATRKSGTLKVSMLYVASLSDNGNYILRMAVPFSGMEQYIGILIPAIVISIGITLIVSLILANRFARSVTRPLNEIAGELFKIREEIPEFQFKHYKYEELNVIADATQQMSEAVKESMKRSEFEKMVRQEFFSNASHELKTPLTSIRGYVELLENDMATDEKMKKDFLSRIKKETGNMTNLINDILMISRLETKEAEVVLTNVRICPLLNEVCDSLEPLAKEYNVKVNTSCRPIAVYANSQHLRELFGNLITNAIKYNKAGGRVDVNVSTEANEIVIIVQDTGVGIPEEAKQRVFERFYRVDKGRSKKVGGTGLGLSIVKHIVGFYNGSIELESKLSEGSKFTVRIPIKQDGRKENSKVSNIK